MEIFGTGALNITPSGPNSVRLVLSGECDRTNAGDLEAAVFAALPRPVRFVYLDLTRLYANRSIHRTLEIAGLAPLFDVVDQSEAEVRAHLVTG
jgi:hypothetical protein